MIKIIYILWLQGFNNAPSIVKQCVQSWKYYNPDWQILLLDKSNLIHYIRINRYVPNIYKTSIRKSHISDIIRLILLKKYGGLWVDSTTFCNRPLNDWLPNYIKEGFFAFEKPTPKIDPNRLLSSWFLYSEKNNTLIRKWLNKSIHFIYKKYHFLDKIDYFFLHNQFYELYKSDNDFRIEWNKVPKISADGPHFLQKDMMKLVTKKIKSNIDNKVSPLYKLTYKCSFLPYDNKITIYYLYSTIRRPFCQSKTSLLNDNILER